MTSRFSLRAISRACFALGLALSATGAWAQDAPVTPGTVTLSGDATSSWTAVTLAPGIQLSTTIAGTVELSPDQKLARAYALCGHKDGKVQMLMCARIEAKVEDTPTTDADRAFIEEVARGLK